MSEFAIGQKVILQEKKDNKIVNVICTVVPDPDPNNELMKPFAFDCWVDNPLRGYVHSVFKDRIKPCFDDKPLPHGLDEHIDNLDAAVFSGDVFMDMDNICKFQSFLDRWQREINSNKDLIAEMDEENGE